MKNLKVTWKGISPLIMPVRKSTASDRKRIKEIYEQKEKDRRRFN